MEVTSTAIQVFGGMGYIEESGVTQHYRDMRIAPIYEGTNGIQAMDLVGRKLGLRMGGVVNDHLDRMRAIDKDLAEAGEELASIRSAPRGAVESLAGVTKWIMTNGLADPREALAGATPYLRMFGIVTGGWLMARQALAAHTRDRRRLGRPGVPRCEDHHGAVLRRAGAAHRGRTGSVGAGRRQRALRGRRRDARLGVSRPHPAAVVRGGGPDRVHDGGG